MVLGFTRTKNLEAMQETADELKDNLTLLEKISRDLEKSNKDLKEEVNTLKVKYEASGVANKSKSEAIAKLKSKNKSLKELCEHNKDKFKSVKNDKDDLIKDKVELSNKLTAREIERDSFKNKTEATNNTNMALIATLDNMDIGSYEVLIKSIDKYSELNDGFKPERVIMDRYTEKRYIDLYNLENYTEQFVLTGNGRLKEIITPSGFKLPVSVRAHVNYGIYFK